MLHCFLHCSMPLFLFFGMSESLRDGFPISQRISLYILPTIMVTPLSFSYHRACVIRDLAVSFSFVIQFRSAHQIDGSTLILQRFGYMSIFATTDWLCWKFLSSYVLEVMITTIASSQNFSSSRPSSPQVIIRSQLLPWKVVHFQSCFQHGLQAITPSHQKPFQPSPPQIHTPSIPSIRTSPPLPWPLITSHNLPLSRHTSSCKHHLPHHTLHHYHLTHHQHVQEAIY